MHDKAVNEVNINTVEENEDIVISSPTDLLTFYQKDDFVYAFYDEIVEDRTIVTMIDFKPIDEDQEFFKIRLSVNKKTNLPIRAKVFYRDGTRIELIFKSIKNTSAFEDADFVLTKDEVGSDVEFIDLRY
jgi:outer membrane lipoprotein carrier protein